MSNTQNPLKPDSDARAGMRIDELQADLARVQQALREQIQGNAELNTRIVHLEQDLEATRDSFAKVVRAVKKARGYEHWPKHTGSFVDFVVFEINLLVDKPK